MVERDLAVRLIEQHHLLGGEHGSHTTAAPDGWQAPPRAVESYVVQVNAVGAPSNILTAVLLLVKPGCVTAFMRWQGKILDTNLRACSYCLMETDGQNRSVANHSPATMGYI